MERFEEKLWKACLLFIRELTPVREGDRFLIYADEGGDPVLGKALLECARENGAVAEIYFLNTTSGITRMVTELTDKIKRGKFDTICELSEHYFYQTAAWKIALRGGSQLYSLAGLDARSFTCCVGRTDHDLMCKFGTTLRDLFREASTVRILTPNGTDIKFRITTDFLIRCISKLGRKPGPFIAFPSGVLGRTARATFLGGQLALNGISKTIEGTAVIDGHIWPPRELGTVKEPVVLSIQRGRVVSIGGSPTNSSILNGWLKEDSKEIQHFCVGFNPGAELSGNILEAERAFGCVSIGVGRHPFHTDCVMKNPTIVLNNNTIEKDGVFVHKELSVLEKIILDNYRSKESKLP